MSSPIRCSASASATTAAAISALRRKVMTQWAPSRANGLAFLATVRAVLRAGEKFRAKYGASDVKKYYSKFDVAVIAQIP